VTAYPYGMESPLLNSPDTLQTVLCFSMVLDEFNNPPFVGLYRLEVDVELINFE